MDILNIVFALTSIFLGAFGWLAPRFTMKTLDMRAGDTTMAMSEVRASAGALFVGMGIGALLIATPAAYAMLGFCWCGAAFGRATSLVMDGTFRKKLIYFIVEAGVGVPAVLLNLG